MRKSGTAKDGGLLLRGENGEFVLHRPRVFQEFSGQRTEVASSYVPRGARGAAIRLGRYNAALPVVMDPTITWGTYLGGTQAEQGLAVALDSSGNAYVTGSTNSPLTFPLKNPYQNVLDLNAQNAFVTEIQANGKQLIYSTYLGGENTDQGSGIAVDSSGDAYVTGSTTSLKFPVVNAIQPQLNGFQNAFITEFNPKGSALVYSTYLGGNAYDLGTGIAVDSTGNAYIAGQTDSANFPVFNAYQNSLGNGAMNNAFLSNIAAGGAALTYSTYLGGSNNDYAAAIAVDSSGEAFLTGTASSTDFPITPGSFQVNLAGLSDAFITKFNASGAALAYSTFLGGANTDQGFGIAVDGSGNAYVTGGTSSTNFPTVNPVQAQLASAPDAFITSINSSGTALLYSTYLGGSGGDQGFAIAVDATGNTYVTGQTRSADFPIIAAVQGALGGTANSFVAELAAQDAGLAFSTYYGGNGLDSGNGIAVDASGNLTVVGTTSSSNLVVSNNIQPIYAGDGDAFVVKLSPNPGPSATLDPISLDFGTLQQNEQSPPMTVTLTNTGNAALVITKITLGGVDPADFSQSNTCPGSLDPEANCTFSITFTPPEGGSLAATLLIYDNAPGNPQSVTLSGVGIGIIPTVLLSPGSLNFQQEPVGQTSPPQTVNLINNGTGPLAINQIQIAGDNKKDFSQSNQCGSTLNAGDSCGIMVTFTPTVAGPRQAILKVTDNASNSPQEAVLTGGGNFLLSALPSSEQVTAGQSTSYIITATPENMFNQTITFTCNKPPQGVACTFSPPALTLDGMDAASTTLTMSTTTRGSVPLLRGWRGVPPAAVLFAVSIFASGFVLFILRRRRIWLATGAALAMLVLAPGCGSSSSSGTPAGQYSIGVQGTYNTYVQTTVVVLTVN